MSLNKSYNKEPNQDSYVQIFVAFSEACEKYIRKVLAILFLLLIVSQLLLQFSPVRKLISKVDQLEGVPYRIDEQVR